MAALRWLAGKARGAGAAAPHLPDRLAKIVETLAAAAVDAKRALPAEGRPVGAAAAIAGQAAGGGDRPDPPAVVQEERGGLLHENVRGHERRRTAAGAAAQEGWRGIGGVRSRCGCDGGCCS